MATSVFVRAVFIGAICLAMNTAAHAQTIPPPDSLVGLLVGSQ